MPQQIISLETSNENPQVGEQITADTFSDVDNDNDAIVKTVLTNTNKDLVTASIEGDELTLDYQDNQSGTAEITIEAESNGKTIINTFEVQVNPVDDPPIVSNPIADVTVAENAGDRTIDLSNTFSDVDGDEITLAVQTNSNETLVTPTFEGNNLTLDFLDEQSGTADITIEATANGEMVSDTFTVTVDEVIPLIQPPVEPPTEEPETNFYLATETIGSNKTIYEYDERGNLIQESFDRDNDGFIDRTFFYEYDDRSNLIKREYINNGEDRVIYEASTYDEQDNLIERGLEYTGDDILDEVYYFTYDEQGNLIEENYDYDNNGTIDRIDTFTYNEQGNLILISLSMKMLTIASLTYLTSFLMLTITILILSKQFQLIVTLP